MSADVPTAEAVRYELRHGFEYVAGHGYWVRNLGASSVVLSIPPVVASKPPWFREVAFGSGASAKPGGVWATGEDGAVLWVSSGPPPPIPGGLAPTGAGGAATPAGTASARADASGSPPASSGGGGGGGGCFLASLGGARFLIPALRRASLGSTISLGHRPGTGNAPVL